MKFLVVVIPPSIYHIPSTYYDLTNVYDEDGTQIDAAIRDNDRVEDEVVPNDENNDEDSLDSEIYPPPKQYSEN